MKDEEEKKEEKPEYVEVDLIQPLREPIIVEWEEDEQTGSD